MKHSIPGIRLLRQACPWSLLVLAACVPSPGCGGDAAIRPDDIRRYEAPKQAERPAPARGPAAGRPALRYDLPAGWSDQGGGSGLRLATLSVGDVADHNEVTVVSASGSLRSNVERWQRQLTDAASEEIVSRAVEEALAENDTVAVEGRTATVVLLDDAPGSQPGRTAILAAMIPLGDTADASALFVKFKGAAEVARRERERFRAFVASIRLGSPGGD